MALAIRAGDVDVSGQLSTDFLDWSKRLFL